jgi:hypothetical protein
VKHLLIILISILLLSSPVIGQETGVLYQYETSSDFVWKIVGSEKLLPKYNGEIKNSKPNGFGFITYPNDEKSIVGEWKEGKEWNTKHTKKDGTLIGIWVNGEWKISWGVLYGGYRNGKGGWYEEEWEGIGTDDNNNFSKYKGEIKNGFPNGQGTETYFDGRKYVGEWKNGKRQGQGTMTYSEESKYEGKWKDDKRQGQGTLTYSDGRKYVGEWKNGKRQGQGTLTYKDGAKYVGEYKDGKKNGQGTFTYPDFTDFRKYVGGWKDGKRHGQGTFTYSDGGKYVGEWKDGVKNGQGTSTYSDGSKYVGELKDGEPWEGKKYHKNGKINFLVLSGKVIYK